MDGMRPQIFDYLDYRHFLKAQIQFLKDSQKLSLYSINRDSKFKSPTHLKFIIEAKRNLTETTARQLARGLRLNSEEAEFFVLLVAYTQSSDDKERKPLYRKMVRLKQLSSVQKIALHQFEALSTWRSVAILEAIATIWRKKSETEMAEAMQCSVKELRDALNTLKDAALIEFKNGEWQKRDPIFHLPVEAHHQSIRNLHREMISKSAETLDAISPEDRANFGMGIALSHESFREIKTRLADFLKDLSAEYQDDSNADDIYYIGLQIFPLLNLKNRDR